MGAGMVAFALLLLFPRGLRILDDSGRSSSATFRAVVFIEVRLAKMHGEARGADP